MDNINNDDWALLEMESDRVLEHMRGLRQALIDRGLTPPEIEKIEEHERWLIFEDLQN